MSHSAVIHARIDPETKAATELILDELGLTPTEAIRLLYRQIAMRKEFPLELRVPNALTATVLKKSENNEEIETFDDSDAIFASWDK
jgi:DNA-damage-inducible protein J